MVFFEKDLKNFLKRQSDAIFVNYDGFINIGFPFFIYVVGAYEVRAFN